MKSSFWAFVCLCAVSALFVSCSEKDSRLAVDKDGKTVVERYGQLQVIGTALSTQDGKPVQLRGMSSHGLQWYGKYANYDVIKWLRDDWNSQIWRSALYLTEGGYIGSPVLKLKMIESVEACLKLGVYVIIDWHVASDKNPQAYQEQSLEFFREMAQKYGSYPNVIYEICNEPNSASVTWAGQIKPYAEAVIAEIRRYDSDNIIIVGTPTWSQDVDIAADDPIKGQKNIMYTMHFYAASHGKELREKTEYALSKGLPIFVTEWGTTKNTGDQFYPEESLDWLSFLDKHNLSWANWSVNNKGEDSGILIYNSDREGKGNWKESDLSKSGLFIRKVLRKETKIK